MAFAMSNVTVRRILIISRFAKHGILYQSPIDIRSIDIRYRFTLLTILDIACEKNDSTISMSVYFFFQRIFMKYMTVSYIEIVY